MRLPYRSSYQGPVVRIRVTPDDPQAVTGPRPRGSRRPHTDATVAQVRRLIEQTTLTYAEIAAKTGVGRASICRWTRDQTWQRPAFAPRATDTVPTARASAHLRRRTLAARLSALAERHVRELEESACVDADKLAAALELLKMAKWAARPKTRRTKPPVVPAQKREARLASKAGTQGQQSHEPVALDSRESLCSGQPKAGPEYGNERKNPTAYEDPAHILTHLQSAGVDLTRAPADALRDVIESHAPPRDFPELRPRGQKSRRNREHGRMLEPE